MKNLKITALLVAGSVALSACGQRSDDAGLSGSSNESTTVRVLSDVASLPTGSSDTATISVLVTDSDNNAISGTDVSFSSNAGVLQDISTVTSANGSATATLNLEQDFENQDLIVTVTSDGSTGQAMVAATGSALNVTGASSLIGGQFADISATLVSGGGDPIANEVVTVSSSSGNTITPSSHITDSKGAILFTVSSENSSDTITLSALDDTVSATHSFEVVSDLLSFSNVSEGTELDVGSDPSVVFNAVTVNWLNQGVAIAGENLNFSITAGSIVGASTVLTNVNGDATISVISDSAGPATISVESAADSSIRAEIDVEFVATEPSSVAVSASSTLVDVGGTSTISAIVKDELGNPVKNSEVSFSSADLMGGQLSPASAITNSSGVASVTFTAGENPSPQDAVAIMASVSGTDFTDTLTLTVFEQQLNLTMGSSNEILVSELANQYSLQFVVQVSDGSGQPLEGVTVSASVKPTHYRKGMLEVNEAGEVWVWADGFIECPSEDFNGDRIIGMVENGAGEMISEDFNNNGSLDPQDPASLVAVDDAETYATLSGGYLETDSTGSGFFNLLYPASNAQWADVEITVRAEALDTESSVTYATGLATSADVATDVDSSPANRLSPYGTDVTGGGSAGLTIAPDVSVPAGCTTSN